MSASKDALRLTTSTIDRRAFHFRNLVVLVVLLVLACPVGALVLWSPRPLIGWLAVWPLCASYLVVDSWLVARWQRTLLGNWSMGDLHLEDFTQSISSLKMLPAATLRAMLATLPRGEEGVHVDRLPTDFRSRLAETHISLQRIELGRAIAYAAAYLAGVVCVGWAIFAWDWRPFLGLLAVVATLLATSLWRGGRLRRCEQDLREFRDSRNPA